MPNFMAIGQAVAEISRFLDFPTGCRRHLGFLKFQILTVEMVKLHHLAKLRRNRSNSGRDMASFQFLDFLIII